MVLNIGPQAMLIGGEWTPGTAGAAIAVETPARRGVVVGSVPRGTAADVDRAVRAADGAFLSWREVPARQRGHALLRIADGIDAAREELARRLATESGNAIRTQARPEIALVADVFRYFGGIAGELKGETIPLGPSMLNYTLREPWGVVGAIVPWNAPVALAALKIAPALVAGNTVVLKPASEAPLAILRVAAICAEHLPAGVLNVVTGAGAEIGPPLASHPLVRKLSFTGSTETGRSLLRLVADRIVPATLELGGKSPSIVFPDSDDDRTADGVIAAMRMSRQGQSCTAGSRLFVHRSIYESFLERLAGRLATLRIGDPLDERSDAGALVSERQFERVTGFVTEAIDHEGARVVTGGLPPTDGPLSEGYYAIPTVFADVRPDWRIAREEVFGPVVVAIPWDDENELVRMANETHYGLAAYVWARDLGAALRTAHRVEAGWIQVNQGLSGMPGQSFGGTKQSGYGREFSLEGMLESYTQRRNVTIDLTRR